MKASTCPCTCQSLHYVLRRAGAGQLGCIAHFAVGASGTIGESLGLSRYAGFARTNLRTTMEHAAHTTPPPRNGMECPTGKGIKRISEASCVHYPSDTESLSSRIFWHHVAWASNSEALNRVTWSMAGTARVRELRGNGMSHLFLTIIDGSKDSVSPL